MSTPTREEIDARLESVELRMDERVAAIEANIIDFVAIIDEQFNQVEARLNQMDERAARVEAAVTEVQSQLGKLKSTIIIAAICTALAVLAGVAALNAAALS